ncbi:F0F1 ATP synthase subunit B' [Profundibacterium mesophilum]|uniref:ATP synthase subunit b n=1 Tax=Profundibacterium mesophilum KAUST100406-0324 TaxID=1037889 RepID=A0A921NWW5_9RHOB|nr:F0F1 ATP synthase subunit B' [Profundibacterium mesophilum]KAF0676930.1 F-type H+-transporting ATPase subunit b [Profundibacterium mesophilum KAUST100406-0324]
MATQIDGVTVTAAPVVPVDIVPADTGPTMPQLDFATFPNQIFWLLVALIAIYYVLSRIALPRIGAILAERQGTITNDLASAEELKLKANEAEAAYDKALADARNDAAQIIAQNKTEMQTQLDAAIERADAEIAERTAESDRRIAEIRQGAIADVEIVARDTAQAIVAALGGNGDDPAVVSAVDARLKGGRA